VPLELILTQWGYFIIDDKTRATTREGVFAGGDIVRGSATVISAVGNSKVAARAINNYLNSEGSLRKNNIYNWRNAKTLPGDIPFIRKQLKKAWELN